jgi:hypothetical protein
MKLIPATTQTLAIAPRIIWFEPPEQALANPIRFMAYAMTYARHEDMRIIREYVSDDDFREALDRAPPGIIDPRSWAYWNLKMGRYPPPPLPTRRFGDDGTLVANASRDSEEIRRQGREGWLKLRQQHPREDAEEIRRRAREEWLAQIRRDDKK